MKTKYITFELDDLLISAVGQYDEENDIIEVVDYECDREVDDCLDEIILDYSAQLLREKFERDELEF